MLIDQYIQRGIPIERKRHLFEPDPAADLIILLRQTHPTEAHPQPWEIAEIIRLRDYRNLSLVDKAIIYRKSVADLMDERMEKKDAKGYKFIDMDDAQTIIEGSNNTAIAQIIRTQADFSAVSVVDVSFDNGYVTSTELTQISPQNK